MSTNEHQRAPLNTRIAVGMKVRSKGGCIGTVVGVGYAPRGYKVRRMPCAERCDLAATVFVDWGENVLADKLFAWGKPGKVAYAYSLDTVQRLQIIS